MPPAGTRLKDGLEAVSVCACTGRVDGLAQLLVGALELLKVGAVLALGSASAFGAQVWQHTEALEQRCFPIKEDVCPKPQDQCMLLDILLASGGVDYPALYGRSHGANRAASPAP